MKQARGEWPEPGGLFPSYPGMVSNLPTWTDTSESVLTNPRLILPYFNVFFSTGFASNGEIGSTLLRVHSLFLLLLLIISVYFLNQIFYQEAHEDILTSPTLEEMLPEDLPVNSIKRTALEFASLKKKSVAVLWFWELNLGSHAC